MSEGHPTTSSGATASSWHGDERWLEQFADPRSNAVSSPYPGQLVDGKYRLGALLGHGGMGWVFEATHLATDKVVALKYLKPRLQMSAEWTRRFAKEARAAGRIDHPNVIRLYDVGGEPPNVYLVMERLRGETLRSRLRRGELPLELGLDIMLAVIRGVQEAHSNGVVHCDLKPENIMLTTLSDGTPDAPKVLDFGLSRIFEARAPADGDSGWEPLGAGTPSYMPLEQLLGRAPDPRVDIYAIGVMLYEILAKRRPFEARTREDLIVQLATTRPRKLDAGASATGELGAVVERALRQDASERFSSLGELERALRAARSSARRLPDSTVPTEGLPRRPGPSSHFPPVLSMVLLGLAAVALLETPEPRWIHLAERAKGVAVHQAVPHLEPAASPLRADEPSTSPLQAKGVFPSPPPSVSQTPKPPVSRPKRPTSPRRENTGSASSKPTDELELRREDF